MTKFLSAASIFSGISKQRLTTNQRSHKSLLRKWTAFCLSATINLGSAFAEAPAPVAPAPIEASAGSSPSYWLFNPVPENALRDLNTDRPDATEGPTTVDAGHVQLEMSFFDYQTASTGSIRTNQWQIAPLNLRLGVLNNLELGVFLNPWTQQTARAGGNSQSHTVAGFSDTTVRVKYNLIGNDGKGLALGLIFDATIPTGANAFTGGGHVDYAAILPLSFNYHGFTINLMTEGDANWDEDRANYRPAWLNSMSIWHDLIKNVAVFGEITSYTSDDPHAVTLNTGGTWQIGKNTQLDFGTFFGVTSSAPALEVFTGISQRF